MMMAVLVLFFALVVGWIILLGMFFSRLRRLHPSTYEALGRPSMFSSNIQPVSRVVNFIGSRGHRSLGDPELSSLSDFMLLYLIGCLSFFSLFLFTLTLSGP